MDWQLHGGARNFHRLTGAAHRGAQKLEIGGDEARRPENTGDGAPRLFRLMAAFGVEGNVLPALKAPFRVPVGLTVAQKNETVAEHGAQTSGRRRA
jgi:hypothetical protein